MSPEAPRLHPRSPAEGDTLAAALVAGGEEARRLLPEGRLTPGPAAADPDGLRDPGPGRLPASALRAPDDVTRQRAEAALEGEGVFVTTGQQPLLFGGPLYVLYKALTAAAVAREITEAGTPAVALFWVAGDDHDWDEVGRTRILDTSNRLHEVRVEPPAERAGRAVGPSPLPGTIAERIDEFSEHLPSSEFVGDHLELLRDAWQPGRSFSEAFGRTLEGLIGGRGIAWLDASDPAVRGAEAPLFRRVLEEPGEVEDRLARGTRRVREGGWSSQVDPREGTLPLFVDTPGGRRRLHRSADGFRIGRQGGEVSAESLVDELEARPERFSPDVALRPVASCWLLPTAVTVLGPAETAYWAQLPELFDWAGVPFPRLRPRDGWVVIEAKVEKVLGKLDAGPDDLADGGRALARAVREEGRPEAVDRALSEARAEVGRALGAVEEAVGRELPGIRSAVGAARHQAFEVLDGLASAVDDRVEEQHSVVLAQIRKAARHLRPDGRPQERVLSPFYYLARYGDSFLERVDRETRRRARPEGTG